MTFRTIRAGVDLRSRRATERHSYRMRRARAVRSSSARSISSLMPARQPSGVKSRDTAGDEVSAQAMLGQAARRFSSGIEARDDLAKNIDHLLIGVDP